MSKPLLPRLIDEYAEQFTTPESTELAALNRKTHLQRGDSVMISGHIQGALLQMLSKMIRPKYVLEIGTFTGYSAICLAAGLQDGGHLHTIEIDEELYDMAQEFIVKTGLAPTITQHTGAALDIIPTLGVPFDLIFIDADKSNYCNYYDIVFPLMPIGGYILADNVLYDGEVVLPPDERSKNARAIHTFNEKVKVDNRIEHMLLPVRDGIMVVRKLRD